MDVGDRVELSVTLHWRRAPERPASSGATTGRRFLEASAARERERHEATLAVSRLAAHLSVDQALIRSWICPRDGVAAIVAVLSERDGVAALRRRVTAFERDDVTAIVYGPLPPYSFIS